MAKKEELRKKDVLKLSESLKKNYSVDFTKFIAGQRLFRGEVKIKKKEINIFYSKANEPFLFELHGDYIPTLQSIRSFPDLLPKVIVDAGAVKFMIKGADLFRPGIVEYEAFAKGQVVTVVNEQQAAMCLGISLYDSQNLPEKGKITITIHHLNDPIWIFPK